MQKLLKTLVVFVAIGLFVFFFHTRLVVLYHSLVERYLPCRVPITYSIGEFDTKFGISKSSFLKAVSDAEAIWEIPYGKNLFQYQDGGYLKINLIYDTRQADTSTLKNLGSTVGASRAKYDSLKAEYDALKAQFVKDQADYDTRLASLQAEISAYNQKVTQANRRGGASPSEYQSLQAEKASIDAEAKSLEALRSQLNTEISQINALVPQLNQLAGDLNLNISQYNAVGAKYSGEFEEGNYQSGPGGEEIDIYQYDNYSKLVRVLAHELGHALGLDHVSDPAAIMYYLNSGTNEEATNADLAELNTLCGGK